MSFFHDAYGHAYPISRIMSIVESSGKQSPFFTVELSDGDKVEIYESEAKRIKRSAGKVIPAAQGTFVLSFMSDEDGGFIGRDPVIGWSLHNGFADPILLDVEFDGVTGNMAYLLPDGRIYDWDGASWDNEDEWSEQLKWRIEHFAKMKQKDAQ
ncbi:hypothetical protein [Novosphingobium sp. HII-3]|uniref:hypothetical protein n=1 Tax=Novosphingobium sp. HII-3 TaxID=2075565 RepID=UPI0011AED281|nr:hypothetical protein [Novosphingobium sp. HII-3]